MCPCCGRGKCTITPPFKRTYQREFGSLGTSQEDCDDEDYGDLEERGAYQREFGSLGIPENFDDLEEVFTQFLGFLQYIGIYVYELGYREIDNVLRDANNEPISKIEHGLDILSLCFRTGRQR